jgi:hypothetical protein
MILVMSPDVYAELLKDTEMARRVGLLSIHESGMTGTLRTGLPGNAALVVDQNASKGVQASMTVMELKLLLKKADPKGGMKFSWREQSQKEG